ncbi:MAG TPA: CHASE3 domain-containing protein [Bryobacteraceae bacterium]|nr:CHASE3 domain-containing protein [Bryobacteraceae bacterium]
MQSSRTRQSHRAGSGRWQSDRAGVALLVSALIVLIFVVVDFAMNQAEVQRLSDQSDHAHAAIDTAENALSSLKDAETGQRGFLLTLNPAYLEPYKTGLRQWQDMKSQLANLTQNDAAVHGMALQMFDAAGAKIRELAETVAVTRREGRAQALARLETGYGRQKMDEARRLSSEIVTREEADFARFARLARETERRTRWSVQAAAGTLFLLTLAGTLLLGREIARERLLAGDLERSETKYRELAESLEEQVEERTRELQDLNAELQAFTYSVSHDLRAPLRAIDGFSLILLEDHGENIDATGKDFLARIRRGVKRMSQLIQSLLDLSRATRVELRKQPVVLSDLAASIVEDLRQTNPERNVEVSIEPGLTAEGDPHLLRIVLENLLSNAWKFSSRTDRARIDIGSSRNGGAREFFVRDNGSGFDPSYAEKLFKPFQRLHLESEFEGTGIGLATAQRIVRRHGGAIRAESGGTGGATFYFSL